MYLYHCNLLLTIYQIDNRRLQRQMLENRQTIRRRRIKAHAVSAVLKMAFSIPKSELK